MYCVKPHTKLQKDMHHLDDSMLPFDGPSGRTFTLIDTYLKEGYFASTDNVWEGGTKLQSGCSNSSKGEMREEKSLQLEKKGKKGMGR